MEHRKFSRLSPIYRHIIFIVIVFAVISNFACAKKQTAEIRIGVLAMLSGDEPVNIKKSGEPTVNAAKLAADEINNNGGIKIGDLKYKIVLFIEDDRNNPNEAAAAAQRLINKHNIAAIIGPQRSKNAIPVAELSDSLHIPMVSPKSTAPATTAGKRYVFRVGFIDPFQGQVLARFAYDSLKARNAAVLYNIASEYNRGLAEAFKKAFTSYGGKISAFENYTTDVTDYKVQLDRIHSAKPDVLILPNFTAEICQQAEQARKTGINAHLLFGDGFGISSVDNPILLDGSYQCGHWHPDSTNPESQTFVTNYKKAYGNDPNETAALTYDAVKLLIYAMEKQGNTDSESIRNGLSGIQRYQGVSGVISYHETGDPVKSAIIWQIKDGKGLFYKQIDP